MAVTANQLITRSDGCKIGVPVAASTTIYQGTLTFIDSSGYLADDTASGANDFAGVAVEKKDNSSGSNGDLTCDVWADGVFELVGSGFTQADVGKDCYAADNYTINLTDAASSVKIGKVVGYVSSTNLQVKLFSSLTENSVVDSVDVNGKADAIILDADGDTTISAPTDDQIDVEVGGSDVVTIGASAVTLADAVNIAVNTTTGTQIGTAAGQKLGFYGTTPAVQPSHVADPAAAASMTFAAGSIDTGVDMTAAEAAAIVADFAALKTAVDANNAAIDSILSQLATLGLQAAS